MFVYTDIDSLLLKCLCYWSVLVVKFLFFFFFQAEDGIRDTSVTGVQTCALPISLTPKFSLLLGKLAILDIADQTLFGDSTKYYFANLNFNKNPIALTFYNTYTIAAAGVWTPTKWLTIAGGVFDPNTQASNFVAHAFDKVNLYTGWIFSYAVDGLPGQFELQYNWTNKVKIDLASTFGSIHLT